MLKLSVNNTKTNTTNSMGQLFHMKFVSARCTVAVYTEIDSLKPGYIIIIIIIIKKGWQCKAGSERLK